jgi:hypothetical protein
MITIEEIKEKAAKKYTQFLTNLVLGEGKMESFLPLQIPFTLPKTKGNYSEIQQWINALSAKSKPQKEYSFSLVMVEKNTHSYGLAKLPEQIFFENERDYLTFIGKISEVTIFKKDLAFILQNFPQLKTWLSQKPQEVIKYANKWEDLLKVCHYFVQNPQPNLYLRQLPIVVHTKFIEENEGILKKLLELLLPTNLINTEGTTFIARHFCKDYQETLVRIIFLDNDLAKQFSHTGITDISLPLSQFEKLFIACKTVWIVENKTNFIGTFLTFPLQKNSIAIFGAGFKVGSLKNAKWLAEKQLFYWGDIDSYGFQILDNLRQYFPKIKSICMDMQTVKTFEDLATKDIENKKDNLVYLTDEEQETFKYMKINGLRIEQEKITQVYVEEVIGKL